MQPDLSIPVNHRINNGSTSYSETWSMHPGAALRRKRGISTKEQQDLAKHPAVVLQDVFESPKLLRKTFHADKSCLIFCGEVREVLGWLHEASIFVDCIVTSPPFYGQRDYGVAGQLGLEQKPDEFITKLVDVLNEAREVLHTTGSLWVNLGDTYWNGRGEHKGRDDKQQARRFGLRPQDRRGDGKLCKNKQLLLIPHRFAIAMQEKDWIVRNDNVWVKPNPIPDQVADRSCMSHEYVFHFVTQRFYYYNRVAVGRKTKKGTYMPPADTWEVAKSRGGTGHKASFSEELVKIPILATTPPKGIVLDPFAGSGTSLLFAKKNGFRSIGIDIKEEYCEVMKKAISETFI
jgi:site-specific DNA-methyltransferase (cytosine-N4-specific)